MMMMRRRGLTLFQAEPRDSTAVCPGGNSRTVQHGEGHGFEATRSRAPVDAPPHTSPDRAVGGHQRCGCLGGCPRDGEEERGGRKRGRRRRRHRFVYNGSGTEQLPSGAVLSVLCRTTTTTTTTTTNTAQVHYRCCRCRMGVGLQHRQGPRVMAVADTASDFAVPAAAAASAYPQHGTSPGQGPGCTAPVTASVHVQQAPVRVDAEYRGGGSGPAAALIALMALVPEAALLGDDRTGAEGPPGGRMSGGRGDR